MMRYIFHFIWGLVFLILWSATPAVADLDDFTVQDQAGRLIQTQTPFTRIISLYGAHTRNLKSLGLDNEIIGVCPNDSADGKPMFSYHDGLEKF